MYSGKKLALNSIGLIVFVFGAMLLLWGIVGSTQVGTRSDTSQSALVGILTAIFGMVLLWRGSKLKESKYLYTD